MCIWADQLLHVQSHTTAAKLWELLVQTHQGLCAATGKTPQDQAVAVLLPEDEATPVQTGTAGVSPHPGHGSGCPQSSRYCVWSLVQRGSVGSTTPDVCRITMTSQLSHADVDEGGGHFTWCLWKVCSARAESTGQTERGETVSEH